MAAMVAVHSVATHPYAVWSAVVASFVCQIAIKSTNIVRMIEIKQAHARVVYISGCAFSTLQFDSSLRTTTRDIPFRHKL
jgi:hypothetical protein